MARGGRGGPLHGICPPERFLGVGWWRAGRLREPSWGQRHPCYGLPLHTQAPRPLPLEFRGWGGPYRHRLGPCDGLCAGVTAWLLRVGLCWCVQGHAMLWGNRGLARVVRRGVRWGWGVLGRDAVLWRRRVLGRGVGLGHRFRRSRGVLIALRRREQGWLDRGVAGTLPPFTGPSPGGPVVLNWTFSSVVQAAWDGALPQHGQPAHSWAARGIQGSPGLRRDTPEFEATCVNLSGPSTLKVYF